MTIKFGNAVQERTRGKKMKERNLALRKELWPDLPEERLWHRTRNKGFSSIPRTIPLVMQLLDELAGKHISNTYFVLWCHNFDESLVIINNPRTMAFEAGFTSQRAENTWNGRMKILNDLGFIDVKSGPSGKYHYVLIWNPHIIIKELVEAKKLHPTETYRAFVDRALSIGVEF